MAGTCTLQPTQGRSRQRERHLLQEDFVFRAGLSLLIGPSQQRILYEHIMVVQLLEDL